VGKGVSSEKVDIAPGDSRIQKLEFHLSNLKMIGKLQSLIESGRFHYRIESHFTTGFWWLPGSTITVNEEGELPGLGEGRSRLR
jgi:hypothetical protein